MPTDIAIPPLQTHLADMRGMHEHHKRQSCTFKGPPPPPPPRLGGGTPVILALLVPNGESCCLGHDLQPGTRQSLTAGIDGTRKAARQRRCQHQENHCDQIPVGMLGILPEHKCIATTAEPWEGCGDISLGMARSGCSFKAAEGWSHIACFRETHPLVYRLRQSCHPSTHREPCRWAAPDMAAPTAQQLIINNTGARRWQPRWACVAWSC